VVAHLNVMLCRSTVAEPVVVVLFRNLCCLAAGLLSAASSYSLFLGNATGLIHLPSDAKVPKSQPPIAGRDGDYLVLKA
jgi:hypothetical protein